MTVNIMDLITRLERFQLGRPWYDLELTVIQGRSPTVSPGLLTKILELKIKIVAMRSKPLKIPCVVLGGYIKGSIFSQFYSQISEIIENQWG